MADPLRVLLLEDNPDDAELALLELKQAGFEPQAVRVETEQDFLDSLAKHWDVILADYSLPQFDAAAALRLIQERDIEVPFLVVTSRQSEEAAVECMKRGADDYVLKDRLARLGPAVQQALKQRRLRRVRRESEEERAQLLAREQKARAEAEAANRRKDQFLAVLSHELRTPLTPVLARLSLLKRYPNLPVAIRSGLEMIQRNVELEARIIDDLLDIARASSGDLQVKLETVDVHETMRAAIDIYGPQIEAKDLQLTTSLNAREHHVRADDTRLRQVFWNLISNAVKFTPAGGRISIGTDNSQAGEIRIEVSDTGVGIEAQTMGRLFRPFEQEEQTLTRHFGGLGLGLAISKTLVTMFGGRLGATSGGRDAGATFTIELKTVAPEAPPPAAPERHLRILLVEDNPDTLRMLSRLLQSSGHIVQTANSISSAIDVASHEPIDLLLTDIGLPDGTAWEMMRQLRRKLDRPIPGIAVSGFVTDADVQRSREAGFVEHIAKPINYPQLEETIQRVAAEPVG